MDCSGSFDTKCDLPLCQQVFQISSPARNGGACPNEGAFRACFDGICGIAGCDGVMGSRKVYDICGECGGSGASCMQANYSCDGVLASGMKFDQCGECGGDDTSCDLPFYRNGTQRRVLTATNATNVPNATNTTNATDVATNSILF